MNLRQKLVATAMLLIASCLAPAGAADAPPASPHAALEQADAARTRALLDRAEAYYREHGDKALAAFSRAGEFQDGELYVYVIGTDGSFLASGGTSAALIGRDVRDLADTDGRYFFREMLEGAKTRPTGSVEYRWSNPVSGRNEPKIATYRLVGERLLVVGYYVPQASIELAKALVWRAAHELKRRPDTAFERFNRLDGGFVHDDLYVFVIGLDDEIVYAHGGSPREVGRKAGTLVDASGKAFALEMIEIAKSKGEGETRYAWRNPISRKVENKHSYVVRVGRYLVGAGAYTGEAR